jgi:hypothetical protein
MTSNHGKCDVISTQSNRSSSERKDDNVSFVESTTKIICPKCSSDQVSWWSGFSTCAKCHLVYAFWDGFCKGCGSEDKKYTYAKAECAECKWEGDPHDLCEEEVCSEINN